MAAMLWPYPRSGPAAPRPRGSNCRKALQGRLLSAEPRRLRNGGLVAWKGAARRRRRIFTEESAAKVLPFPVGRCATELFLMHPLVSPLTTHSDIECSPHATSFTICGTSDMSVRLSVCPPEVILRGAARRHLDAHY